MTAYIGGERQTLGEKNQRVQKLLRPIVPRDLGWRWQCYCGKTMYVRYRGRFYCRTCGHRVSHPDVLTSKGQTFRQVFDEAVLR